MPRHFRGFKAAGNHSPGAFLIPQNLDIGTAIDELVIIRLAPDVSERADRRE
jgi:hypothetical protein